MKPRKRMKQLRKWFIWNLAFLLILTSLPVEGWAEAIHAQADNTAKPSPSRVPPAPSFQLQPGELMEQRTERTKVFYNGDGTFTKHIYFEPIHLKKKGEKRFEEISPGLMDRSDRPNVVETDRTMLETDFYKKMVNGEYATFHYNGSSISYSIVEASGEGVPPLRAKDVVATYQKKDNKILHKNVFPHIDLQNIAFNESTKEDIVLRSFNGYHSFKFHLKTDLHAAVQEDGSILFTNQKKEKVFELPKPFMVDSNLDERSGEVQRSEQVTYELQPDDQGYILTVTADPEWLKDPKRVYPVYIDPSTSIQLSTDTFVMSAYPTTNYSSASSKWDSAQGQYVLKVGYYDGTTGTCYGFLNPDISSVKNMNVTSATFNVYVTHSYYATTATGLWLDAVNGSWSASTLTWNNQPSSTNIGKVDVARDQWAQLNVTNTVKEWAAGTKPNYGLKLHTNGNGQTYWKKVVSGTNSTYKPYLSVTYTIPVPNTPTGTAYSNGDGTGYVDLSWNPVPGATGYKVWIYNGKEYESFSVGNVTSWSTKGKKIWPTASEISAGRYDLHQDGLGTELAVDPSPVYRHSGGSYPNSKNYWFRVSAIFPQGESAVSEAYMPTIPNLAKPSAPTGKSYTNGDGTGYIDVQWNPVSGATGYKIWIFNGASYESLNVGNVTSWTTKGKKYWPTPAEVDAGRYQLHLNDSRGAELPVDPSWTYANAGTRYENSTNYWIRVSAYNSQGETVFSEAYMPRISPLPKPAAPLGVAFGYDDKKGTVELSWGRLEGATGYKVWIFNGKEYESIDVGNVNTWTTAEKGIWPRDEDIANGRYKLCLDGSGTELDINPSTLYTNADVKYANSNNYYFRISAYDQYGETVVSEAFVSSISPVTEKEAMIDNTPVDEEGWIEEEYEDIDITTDSEKVLKDLKENISETSDQIKELRDFPETTEIYNELSNVDIEEEVVKGEINNLTYQIENEKIIYSESSITESVQSNSVATNNLSFTSSEPDDTSEEIEEVFYDYPEDMFLPETIVNVDTNLVLVDSNTGETYSTEEYISQSVAKEQRDTVHTASYLPQLGYFLTKEVTYVKNAGTTNATIVHCSTVVQAGGNLRPNYFTVKASFLSSNDVNGPFDVAASTTKYNVKLLQDVCVEKRITSTKFWIGKTHITAHYKGGYTSQKVKMSEKFLLNKKGVIYPYYRDPRMRKVMKKPSSTTWDRVPKEQRVKWSTSQRDKYLDWYIENYGFIIKSFYEVHHIRPREYGGNNDYSNLIPLLSSFHRKVVNPWWTNYK